MIAQVGKHLRKWLLGMALAVRNQAQAVVAKMESIEAEKSIGAERKIAPGAAKTARSGEPPAHWLQLVKRHAPELLQPGPPYASRPASAQVFETDAGRDESAGTNPQEPVSAANRAVDADEAQPHENTAFSLRLARLSREHGAPPGRRPPPTPGGKSQAGDSDRPPEAAPRRARDDTAPHTPEALPAGSVNVRRAGVPATGAAKMTFRRFLSLQPNARLVDPPVTGIRGPQSRNAGCAGSGCAPLRIRCRAHRKKPARQRGKHKYSAGFRRKFSAFKSNRYRSWAI